MYEMGFSVLGVLIARASAQPLETFLRERIFEPLGMSDTGFSVPAAKLDRLASCYQVDPETGALALYDGADHSQWSRPPAFPSTTGGLVSTVDDDLAFGQMTLNKGKHGGERLLSLTKRRRGGDPRALRLGRRPGNVLVFRPSRT